jgi:hypothetical protein
VTNPSDYQDTLVLNTLDGFNLQPRFSIPFDGPIDVTTVTSNSVFLVRMGDTLNPHDHGGQVVGINQVVWDVDTKTLHVESDQLLDQHTRYALIMTNGVHDAGDHAVEATLGFRLAPLTLALSHDPVLRNYGQEMVQGLLAAYRAGVHVEDIVTASVFTTESATAVLEKIRDQIHTATPAAADFNLGPDGTPTVFSFDQLTGITLTQQNGWNLQNGSPVFAAPVALNLPLLRLYPGAVGEIAFGSYQSPDYEVHPGEYIPPVASRTGTPLEQGTNTIYFDLVLPSGPEPPAGWPVAIYSHGGGSNKDISMALVAASMAEQGIATIIINDVGNGLGPHGTLMVTTAGGSGPMTFTAGGRGIDQVGDGVISPQEGFSATLDPTTGQDWSLITARDGVQQTAADLMQLVRVIQVGMNVPSPDGGSPSHLDPNRIYYFGWSNGANIGAPFLAVEPDVQVGDLTNPGHSYVNEVGRLSNRGTIGTALAGRVPSLLNSPGITSVDGRTISQPWFDDNMPLRNGIPLYVILQDGTMRTIQSPVMNTVAGAMAIQEFFDNGDWASQAGNPEGYAPHLRKDPLAGVPAKTVIVQLATGDQTATNPSVTAVIRAGDLADRATLYRHDLAFVGIPGLPTDPHRFVVATDVAAFRPIALAAQAQIATFFASDGTAIIQPPGVPEEFFEVPIAGPLPEDLNFILASAPAPAPASASRVSGPIPMDPAGGSPPIPVLFAAVQPSGTAVGPGAVIAASWTSEMATPLLDEGTPFGAGATSLAEYSLPENSLDPDRWKVNEPTRADQIFHRHSRAPATSEVLDQVFADGDDSWRQDMLGAFPTATRVD